MSTTTSDLLPAIGESVTKVAGIPGSTPAGSVAWTSPSNVQAIDGSDATVTPGAGNTSHSLWAHNYDLSSISSVATIEGIAVKVYATATGAVTLNCALMDASGGFPASITKTVSVNGAHAVYTFGGPTDTWATGATPGAIQGYNFGARLWYTGAETVGIDYVEIAVTYSILPTILTADKGTYGYAGASGSNTVLLEIAHLWPILPVSYAYAGASGGNAVLLERNRAVLPVAGAYPYTGATTTQPEVARVTSANVGAYAYTGATTTNLVYARIMPALAGTYAYTVYTVGLVRASGGTVPVGAYAYTGATTTQLERARVAALTSTAYAYTGATTTVLVRTRIMPASPPASAYPYTVYTVGLVSSGPIPAGAYLYTVYPVTLTKIAAPVSTDKVLVVPTATFRYKAYDGYIRIEPIKINWRLLNAPPLQAWSYNECYFDLTYTPVQLITGGTPSTPFTDHDKSMVTTTSATVTNNAQVISSVIAANYQSLNTTAASVSKGGYVTCLTGSSATTNVLIVVNCPRMTRKITVPVSQTPGVTTLQFLNYIPGSLAQKLCDEIDSRIAGKTVAANGPCFTSFNPWTRNPNCWAHDVDLSPLSIQNNLYATNSSPTLITPRHFLQCHHYPIAGGQGNWVQYLSADGTDRICQRTVVAAKQITVDTDPLHGVDVWLGTLDSDVDDFISYCKFLPSNWQAKLPSLKVSAAPGVPYYPIPIFMQDKNKGAWVFEWYQEWLTHVTPNGTIPYDFYYMQGQQPSIGTNTPQRVAFQHYLIGGDSGSSGCLIFNNKLVFLAPIGGGSGSGGSCVWLINRINTEILELGNDGGHQCEFVDFSAYPDL